MPRRPAPANQFEILEEADVPVASLVDDPQNVNVHDERGLEALTLSLKRFKQVKRLVARKSDRVVFAGNGVLEVLRRLGWQTARIQWVEGTDDECHAFAVADNRTNRLSRFDDDNLSTLLQELSAIDPALRDASGWNEDETKRLLADLQKETPKKGATQTKGAAALHATCPKCGHSFPIGSE